MVIVSITIKAAFLDHQFNPDTAVADLVAEGLVRYVRDGLDAEVTFTTLREERHLKADEVDYYEHDDKIEAWQEQAREEMEA